MGTSPPSEPFDSRTADMIRYKAKKLARHPAVRPDDAEDLEVELSIGFLIRRRKFDPYRGSLHGFVHGALDCAAASIIERISAKKREDRGRRRPFDSAAAEATTPDLDLVLDVREAVRQLPAQLQRFAWLFAAYSDAEVARRTGKTRQQVRSIKRRIAAHFSGSGLSGKKNSSIANQVKTASGI